MIFINIFDIILNINYEKSILKVLLLGGVIFGGSQVQASAIAEEAQLALSAAMVEEEQGPIQCLAEVVTRVEQMEGRYSPETLDRILQMEIEKYFNATHSLL